MLFRSVSQSRYPVSFETLNGVKIIGKVVAKSKHKEVYDQSFSMNLGWYADKAVFVQKLSFDDAAKIKIKGNVEFMVCNDESCLPPTQEYFDLGNGPATSDAKKTDEKKALVIGTLDTTAAPDTAKVAPVISTSTPGSDLWKPVIAELQSFGNSTSASTTSLWLIFLAGLLGGFLALFTPCVWPIIPMTLVIVTGKQIGRAHV